MKLLQKHAFLFFLMTLLVKTLFFPTSMYEVSIVEICAFLVFGALHALTIVIDHKQAEKINTTLVDQIEITNKLKSEMQTLNESMSTLRLSSGFRNQK